MSNPINPGSPADELDDLFNFDFDPEVDLRGITISDLEEIDSDSLSSHPSHSSHSSHPSHSSHSSYPSHSSHSESSQGHNPHLPLSREQVNPTPTEAQFGDLKLESLSSQKITINGCSIEIFPGDGAKTRLSYLAFLDNMGIPKCFSFSVFGDRAQYQTKKAGPAFGDLLPLLEFYRDNPSLVSQEESKKALKTLLGWMYAYYLPPEARDRMLHSKRFEHTLHHFEIVPSQAGFLAPVNTYPLAGIISLSGAEVMSLYRINIDIPVSAKKRGFEIDKLHQMVFIQSYSSYPKIVVERRPLLYGLQTLPYEALYNCSGPDQDGMLLRDLDANSNVNSRFNQEMRGRYVNLYTLYNAYFLKPTENNKKALIMAALEVMNTYRMLWKNGGTGESSYFRKCFGNEFVSLIETIERALGRTIESCADLSLPTSQMSGSLPSLSLLPEPRTASSKEIEELQFPISESSLSTPPLRIEPVTPLSSSALEWKVEESSRSKITINGCTIEIFPGDFEKTRRSYLEFLEKMGIPKNFSLPIYGTSADIISSSTPSKDLIPLLEYRRCKSEMFQNPSNAEAFQSLSNWLISNYSGDDNFEDQECIFEIRSFENPSLIENKYPFAGTIRLTNSDLMQLYGITRPSRISYLSYSNNQLMVEITRPELLDFKQPSLGQIRYVAPFRFQEPNIDEIALHHCRFKNKASYLAKRREELKKAYDDRSPTTRRFLISTAVSIMDDYKMFWKVGTQTKSVYVRNKLKEQLIVNDDSYYKKFFGEDFIELIQNVETYLERPIDALVTAEYPVSYWVPKKATFSSFSNPLPIASHYGVPKAPAASSYGISKERIDAALGFQSAPSLLLDLGLESPVSSIQVQNVGRDVPLLPSHFANEARLLTAEEIQATENQLQSLNRLIRQHYGTLNPSSIHALLMEQKGRWSIDVSIQDRKEILLAPFYQFLRQSSSLQNKDAAIRAVREALSLFGLTSSSMSVDESQGPRENFLQKYAKSGEPDDLLIRGCVDELLRENQAPSSQFQLYDFTATEIRQSLLSLKLEEFSVIAQNYSKFSKRVETNPASVPCFLITQDENQVRVQIIQAHFNSRQVLEGVGEDENGLTSRFLQGQFPGEALNIRDEGDRGEGKYVMLDWEKFQKLESVINDPSLSSLPKAIVIQRLNPVSDKVETEQSLHPTKKRRLSEEEKRGAGERKELQFQHGYHSLSTESTDLQIEAIPVKGQKRKAPAPSTGDHPMIPSAQWSTPIEAPPLQFDHFWSALNAKSLHEVGAKVSREVIKEVALKEMAPLSYPIVNLLPTTPRPQGFVPFGRLLKPYQVDAANELLHYSAAGVSKLLSPAPGLGKTMIFSEFLAQRIAAENGNQIYLVAGPDAVLSQTHQEICRFMAEAAVTAWQLTGLGKGEREHTKGYYLKLFRSIVFSKCSSADLARFLRIIPYFPDAHEHAVSEYRSLLNSSHVAGTAMELLQKHFEEIGEMYQEKPEKIREFQEKIKARIHKGLDGQLTIPERFDSLGDLFGFLEIALQELRDQQISDKRNECIYNTLSIIGYALDQDPGRSELKMEDYSHITNESLQKVRDFGIGQEKPWIKKCKGDDKGKMNFRKLAKEIGLDPKNSLKHPLILLTTVESLPKLSNSLSQFPVGALIIDEAGKIHNERNETAQNVIGVIQQLRLHSRPDGHNPIVFVTGTPFENSIQELWTLLKISNKPEMFCKETLGSLVQTLFTGSIQTLTGPALKKSGESTDEDLLIRAFIQFMQFRMIVRQLVYSLEPEQFQVQENWMRRFPKVEYQPIEQELSPEFRDLVNQAMGLDSLTEASFYGEGTFATIRRVERILLHQSLANTMMEELKEQNWPFLDPLKDPNQARKWLKESPLLSAVLSQTAFLDALENREKFVIVASQLGQCKAYEQAIKTLFSNTHQVFIRIFHGELPEDKKAQVIREFKEANPNAPAILLLMIKAGGVGLNLGEATRLFLTTTSMNPGVEKQAIARIVRANHIGTRIIHPISFPETFYSAHAKIIQDVKRKWDAFFWKDIESIEDSLALWVDLLLARTHHSLLIHLKDMERADEENQLIEMFLNTWAKSFQPGTLENFMTRTAPTRASSSSSSSSSMPLDPRQQALSLPPSDMASASRMPRGRGEAEPMLLTSGTTRGRGAASTSSLSFLASISRAAIPRAQDSQGTSNPLPELLPFASGRAMLGAEEVTAPTRSMPDTSSAERTLKRKRPLPQSLPVSNAWSALGSDAVTIPSRSLPETSRVAEPALKKPLPRSLPVGNVRPTLPEAVTIPPRSLPETSRSEEPALKKPLPRSLPVGNVRSTLPEAVTIPPRSLPETSRATEPALKKPLPRSLPKGNVRPTLSEGVPAPSSSPPLSEPKSGAAEVLQRAKMPLPPLPLPLDRVRQEPNLQASQVVGKTAAATSETAQKLPSLPPADTKPIPKKPLPLPPLPLPPAKPSQDKQA